MKTREDCCDLTSDSGEKKVHISLVDTCKVLVSVLTDEILSPMSLCCTENMYHEMNTEHDPKYSTGTIKHNRGDVTLWGWFSSAWTDKLVRRDGKMDGAKGRSILRDNKYWMLWKTWDWAGGWPFSRKPLSNPELKWKGLDRSTLR